MKTNKKGRTYYDVRTSKTRVGRFATIADAASAYRRFWDAQQVHSIAQTSEGSSSMASMPQSDGADETVAAAAALCAVRDA